MKRLCIAACVLLFFTSSVFALDIRVAPRTLVLSSSGGKLTVHTDVPIGRAGDVNLAVNETDIADFITYADDRGNLVVQCTKEAASVGIPDFRGKTTWAKVGLDVDVNGTLESDSESIRVKK